MAVGAVLHRAAPVPATIAPVVRCASESVSWLEPTHEPARLLGSAPYPEKLVGRWRSDRPIAGPESDLSQPKRCVYGRNKPRRLRSGKESQYFGAMRAWKRARAYLRDVLKVQRVAQLSHSLYTVANPEFAGRAVQLSLRLELVPHLPHGEDVTRFGGIRLELSAQLGHVRVDGPAHD
jgi:hypothetical protein